MYIQYNAFAVRAKALALFLLFPSVFLDIYWKDRERRKVKKRKNKNKCVNRMKRNTANGKE